MARKRKRTPRRDAKGHFVKKARKNPTRARSTHHSHKRRRRRSHRGLAGYRHNPVRMGGFGSLLQGTVVPVMIGAGGAVVTDMALGVLPLPATFKTPGARVLVKVGVGSAIGLGAGFFAGRRVAAGIIIGASTVAIYDGLRALIQRVAPQVALGGLAENDFPRLEYVERGPGMGELFITGETAAERAGMGEVFDGDGMGNTYEEGFDY